MKKIMFNDAYRYTKAVLDRRKTKTRRICREQHWSFSDLTNANINHSYIFERPPYEIGEIVAIAQSYNDAGFNPELPLMEANGLGGYVRTELAPGWTNKMFVRADLMPNQIQFTNLHVERLQEISDDDCIAEGIEKVEECRNLYCQPIFHKSGKVSVITGDTPREVYSKVINRIYGKDTWERNPFVFAYDFILIEGDERRQ